MTDKKSTSSTRSKTLLTVLKVLFGLIVVFYLVGAILNYRFPDFFTPQYDKKLTGDATVSTLIQLSEEFSSHWLPNDVAWPSVLLDNPQNYQLGQLEVVRYSVRVLRDNLSRLRTTDQIDNDADMAYTSFSNDPMRWMLPSAESKFLAGVKHLETFRQRLQTGKAHFYPRGDNLIELLNQMNSLLGGVCTRLSMIPSDYNEFLSEETAGDTVLQGEKRVRVEIGWTEKDDHFYFAQGVAMGLRQVLVAVGSDFTEILQTKKATELLQNIIVVLEHTQWEPKYAVMNCSPGSWIPCQNDPMMLNSRMQDARQKIRSLISMIEN